jgi:hypothetical protein
VSDTSRARRNMAVFSLAMIAALLAAVVLASGVAARRAARGARRRGCTAPRTVSGTALSNFFLWAWIFHGFDDDDYQEEYGGALGIWLLIWSLRRHSIR